MYGIIVSQDRLEQHPPYAGVGKQSPITAPPNKPARYGKGQHRHHRDQGVAQGMFKDNPVLRQSLCPGGAHIIRSFTSRTAERM